MEFINRIQKKRFLNKIFIEKKQRNAKFHYLQESQNIGIIINYDEYKTNEIAETFYEFLKNTDNNIQKLYFITKKINKNYDFPENTISIKGNKCIKNELLNNFLLKKFDIIYIFNFTENFKLHYIISKLNADLIVSPHYKDNNFADFTFILDNVETKEDTYIDAIKKYTNNKNDSLFKTA